MAIPLISAKPLLPDAELYDQVAGAETFTVYVPGGNTSFGSVYQ
jgi:hypothetical protein